jgi:hypothetical protein
MYDAFLLAVLGERRVFAAVELHGDEVVTPSSLRSVSKRLSVRSSDAYWSGEGVGGSSHSGA